MELLGKVLEEAEPRWGLEPEVAGLTVGQRQMGRSGGPAGMPDLVPDPRESNTHSDPRTLSCADISCHSEPRGFEVPWGVRV